MGKVRKRHGKRLSDCIEETLGSSWVALPAPYSVGGALLTSTEDIVGWWKEYFKDLFSLTDMSFIEEAESGEEFQL